MDHGASLNSGGNPPSPLTTLRRSRGKWGEANVIVGQGTRGLAAQGVKEDRAALADAVFRAWLASKGKPRTAPAPPPRDQEHFTPQQRDAAAREELKAAAARDRSERRKATAAAREHAEEARVHAAAELRGENSQLLRRAAQNAAEVRAWRTEYAKQHVADSKFNASLRALPQVTGATPRPARGQRKQREAVALSVLSARGPPSTASAGQSSGLFVPQPPATARPGQGRASLASASPTAVSSVVKPTASLELSPRAASARAPPVARNMDGSFAGAARTVLSMSAAEERPMSPRAAAIVTNRVAVQVEGASLRAVADEEQMLCAAAVDRSHERVCHAHQRAKLQRVERDAAMAMYAVRERATKQRRRQERRDVQQAHTETAKELTASARKVTADALLRSKSEYGAELERNVGDLRTERAHNEALTKKRAEAHSALKREAAQRTRSTEGRPALAMDAVRQSKARIAADERAARRLRTAEQQQERERDTGAVVRRTAEIKAVVEEAHRTSPHALAAEKVMSPLSSPRLGSR